MVIGVLAIQGSFQEHLDMLMSFPRKRESKQKGQIPAFAGMTKKGAGMTTKPVRSVADLDGVDALIMPGGESTTMNKLMADYGLDRAIIKRVKAGMPLYGTCAGMILMAGAGLMDITVERNAYGRQMDSFETMVDATDANALGVKKIPAVFIRAPKIKKIGRKVLVLATLEGVPVLVRQGNLLASSFHPELTDSTAVHRYFVTLCQQKI